MIVFSPPRGRWSDDLASDPNLSSPEQSEQELEARKEESGNEEDREDHVYQSLERQENNLVTEPVYAQLKVRLYRNVLYVPDLLPPLLYL